MKNTQWILLAASVALGIMWIFIIQNWIFLNGVYAVITPRGADIRNFIQVGSSPAFTVLWAACISALMIWIAQTLTGRPKSSQETRRLRPMWWIAFLLLVVFGWLCLSWFMIFTWTITSTAPYEGAGVNYFPMPAGGWLVMAAFVFVDVILLFWVPTLLASPRTYRFVVPFAVKLLGSR